MLISNLENDWNGDVDLSQQVAKSLINGEEKGLEVGMLRVVAGFGYVIRANYI